VTKKPAAEKLGYAPALLPLPDPTRLQKANLPTRVIQAWMGHYDIRHTDDIPSYRPRPFREVWREKD
jgi:hypothetical protein